jgi:drug/metabolite transporter (DMT)-like permease
MIQSKSRSVLILVLVMAIWSSSYSITKTAVRNLPPFSFAFLRFVFASVLLGAYSWISTKQVRLPGKKQLLQLTGLGLSGITFYYIAFNTALYYTSASAGAMIAGMAPVIVAVLAALLLKERMRAAQQWGIGISVAGVVLIALTRAPAAQAPHALLGNLLMLTAILCWGFYTILSRRMDQWDPLWLTAWSTAIGTVLLLPAVAVELHATGLPVITLQGWLSILYLGCLGSALCYLLYNHALKKLPASTVGLFINLEPLMGVVIAVVFLHERLAWMQLAGGVLVLLGISLGMVKKRVRRQPASPPCEHT